MTTPSYNQTRNSDSVDDAFIWLNTPRDILDARVVHDLIADVQKYQGLLNDAYRMLNTTLNLPDEEAKLRARAFLISRQVLTDPEPKD